jgi:hypothetical protein
MTANESQRLRKMVGRHIQTVGVPVGFLSGLYLHQSLISSGVEIWARMALALAVGMVVWGAFYGAGALLSRRS